VPTGSRPDIGAFERGGVAPGISYEDSFDGAATGPLANDTNGWRVVSTGNEVRVMDTPSPPTRASGSTARPTAAAPTGTSLARIFGTPFQAWSRSRLR
jgi:hypothetical protein